MQFYGVPTFVHLPTVGTTVQYCVYIVWDHNDGNINLLKEFAVELKSFCNKKKNSNRKFMIINFNNSECQK